MTRWRRGIQLRGLNSRSDSVLYIKTLENLSSKRSKFSSFRRSGSYRTILEHTSYRQGLEYIEFIESRYGTVKIDFEGVRQNDLVGEPYRFKYENFGLLSPSTLRYLAIALHIRELFGDNLGNRVAEIGVGYGGQLKLLDLLTRFNSYDLFDLPLALDLAEMYLESFLLRNSYRRCLINQTDARGSYDLVISNYAFSELSQSVQRVYIEKILLHSRCGYMIMNSGTPNSIFSSNCLSLSDLRKFIPHLEILEEPVLTYPGNYLLIWR